MTITKARKYYEMPDIDLFKDMEQPVFDSELTRPLRVRQSHVIPGTVKNHQAGNLSNKTRSVIVSLDENAGDFSDIQKAIDFVEQGGGGIVFIKNGTYKISKYINVPSFVVLLGESREGVILDCNRKDAGIKIEGKNQYTEGTVSVTQGSTVVTGSGTTWSSNVKPGYHIQVGRAIIFIRSVDSDTQLTLGNPYVDSSDSGLSYTTADFNNGAGIENLLVLNPLNDGIILEFANRYFITNTDVRSSISGYGFKVTDCSEGTWNFITSVFNGGGGVSVTRATFTSFGLLVAASNAANGFEFTSCSISLIDVVVSNGNSVSGLVLDDCDNLNVRAVDMLFNGNHGIEMSDTQYIIFSAGRISGTANDGLRMTSNCDYNTVNGLRSFGNDRGIHIVESTSQFNIVTACQLKNNTTAALTDAGTGTVSGNNVT